MNNRIRSELMVVRGTVGLLFESAIRQKIRLWTGGNSIYSIELFPGTAWNHKLDGDTFTMRHGDVVINGWRHNNVPIGYCPARGTLLVLNPANNTLVRRSTGIVKNESVT